MSIAFVGGNHQAQFLSLETIGQGDKQLNRKRISNVFYSAVFCNNFCIAFFS